MSRNTTAPKNSDAVKKGSLYSTLAIAYIAISFVALFLPLTVISGNSLQTKLFALFSTIETTNGMLGALSTIVRLAFILTMVATIALSALTLVKKEKEAEYASLASLVFVAGCSAYTLSIMAGSLTLVSLKTENVTFGMDIVTLILSVVGLAIYAFLASKATNENFLSNLAQFGLTLGYTILMILAAGTVTNEPGFLGILVLLVIMVVTANIIFEAIRLKNDGNLFVDRIRFIGEVVAAAALFFVTLLGTSTISGILLSLVAIAFALGQVELIRTKIKRHLKKLAYASRYENRVAESEEVVEQTPFDEMPEETDEFAYARPYGMPEPAPAPFARPMPMPSPMAAAVDPVCDPFSGFRVEEYAEAFPYEGGPINGVEMAEEVNPTFIPNPAANQVNTAGYDFYNSKSFDPFIATLDMKERNEFTELFILKYKGVMPEIPDYEVGGDNREFFRKLFIYLGQYRERISSELLNKIYNFSIKLS